MKKQVIIEYTPPIEIEEPEDLFVLMGITEKPILLLLDNITIWQH